jgi:ribosome silencing factor RsfS/YbeB/iojap
MNIEDRIESIVDLIDTKKGEEIVTIDLKNKDYVCEHVIIASSLGGQHTLALLDHLKESLKKSKEKIIGTQISEDWAVIDLGDIMIHLMSPQFRSKYLIEEFLSELAQEDRDS